MMRRVPALVVCAGVALVACAELRAADDPAAAAATPDDAGSAGDGGTGSGGPATSDSGSPGSSGGADGGANAPGAACRPLVLDCLDATAANVIEVPTESTLQDAFANAKANDVVQIKGASLGAGWRIPAYVTLRGCAGAKIAGEIGFTGSGGIVEGFTVTGAGGVTANVTGSYVVRQNRFVGPAGTNTAGVSGRSIDGLVSAQVTLTVEANAFDERSIGVDASTSYDTGTRSVTVTVRNNVFRGVATPVRVSEGGLVGVIDATILHNSFYDFGTAISLYDVSKVVKTSANVFMKGASAVKGSPYETAYSFAWQVATPAGSPANAGAFANADPLFVDAANGDLRPAASSPLVDAIPSGTPVPADDYQGCPRPAGPSGAAPRADVGAYENP